MVNNIKDELYKAEVKKALNSKRDNSTNRNLGRHSFIVLALFIALSVSVAVNIDQSINSQGKDPMRVSSPAAVMQPAPVIYSPYTIEQPENHCRDGKLPARVFGQVECWGA